MEFYNLYKVLTKNCEDVLHNHIRAKTKGVCVLFIHDSQLLFQVHIIFNVTDDNYEHRVWCLHETLIK